MCGTVLQVLFGQRVAVVGISIGPFGTGIARTFEQLRAVIGLRVQLSAVGGLWTCGLFTHSFELVEAFH